MPVGTDFVVRVDTGSMADDVFERLTSERLSGTVTFLFTNIEGSTRLLGRSGRILRANVAASAGVFPTFASRAQEARPVSPS